MTSQHRIRGRWNFARKHSKPIEDTKIGYGYIYVLDLQIDKMYKVGKTTKPQDRLKALQAGNPKSKFIILYRLKNYAKCEKKLHKKLRKKKVEREIFKLTADDLDFIKLYLDDFVSESSNLTNDEEDDTIKNHSVSIGILASNSTEEVPMTPGIN